MAQQKPSATQLVLSQADKFKAVMQHDKQMNFDSEAGFAIQILDSNDFLTKIALGNPKSLQSAIVNVAACGISLCPTKKHAYLIPRKVKGGGMAVCLDISYLGLIHIATTSGAVEWAQAVIVHEDDRFEIQTLGKPPVHEYKAFKPRGAIVGVYAAAKTRGGDFLVHPMPISKVYAIRDRSESWKAHVQDKSKTTPWATDEEEMIKKTVLRQAQKTWPKNDWIDKAMHHLDNDPEGIDFEVEQAASEHGFNPVQERMYVDLKDAAMNGLESVVRQYNYYMGKVGDGEPKASESAKSHFKIVWTKVGDSIKKSAQKVPGEVING